MYPAKNGDAFLVDAGGTYILIDAGFARTYQAFIATDLAQLVVDGSRLDLVFARTSTPTISAACWSSSRLTALRTDGALKSALYGITASGRCLPGPLRLTA